MDPNDRNTDAAGQHADDAQLVPLFLANQARIYSFIVSLVANRSDAEDILQETGLVLHRRFNEFQPSTNFLNWACQIAHNKVLDLRKRQSRSRVFFDSDFVEVMAEHQLLHNEELAIRQAALLKCLDKLVKKDRELIEQYYHPGATAKRVAEELRRPVDTIYKNLRRIRGLLFGCVSRSISAEGRS